jgi:hypothetical protein
MRYTTQSESYVAPVSPTRTLFSLPPGRTVKPGGLSLKAEAHRFPELYNLWLTVKEFPCQNLVFRNARLLLHRPDIAAKVFDYDFAALIRDYDASDPWMEYPRKFIADDLFTGDEKAAIEAYLARHHFQGITLYKARQTFPIPNQWSPCNAAGYGPWEGEYLFDEEEGFDCPVKFRGHYWLGETPVVAGLAQITCEWDGSITIDGKGSPSTLMAEQVDMLSKTYLKARSLGKAERITLRYDLPLDRPLAHSAPPFLLNDRVSRRK